MQVASERFGELDTLLLSGDDCGSDPERLIVLCHGFGAPGDDLAGLGQWFLQHAPTAFAKTLFAFPAAPLSMESVGWPGARAWWMLDLDRVQRVAEAGGVRDLSGETPEGLLTAGAMLTTTLAELRSRYELPMASIIIGGFSQGAMIATDVALHSDESPAALWLFSGNLLWESRLRDALPSAPRFPIKMSHGMSDAVLPYSGAERLRDLLTESGYDVDFRSFAGGHAIPRDALEWFATSID